MPKLESDQKRLRSKKHTAESDIVVVHQPVNGLDVAADIVLVCLVEQVLDSGVLWISSEDFL